MTWAHHAEHDTVDIAGRATAYRRRGDGAPIVYLHGSGFTRVWLPFLTELTAHGEVIAPEHPGYGDSAIDDTIQSFEDLVLHYDALLQALGLERPQLVGHGLGGWVAADLAVTYPRRFAGLTLVNPMGLPVPGAPLIDQFRMTPEEAAAALFNGREDRYAEYLVQEGDPEDMIRSLTERSTAARLAWNPRYDYRLEHRLARVAAPTLVIGVQDDRVVPTATAARFAERIPGARLETVAGGPGEPSGHAVHIEQPETVAALVGRHIAAGAAGAPDA